MLARIEQNKNVRQITFLQSKFQSTLFDQYLRYPLPLLREHLHQTISHMGERNNQGDQLVSIQLPKLLIPQLFFPIIPLLPLLAQDIASLQKHLLVFHQVTLQLPDHLIHNTLFFLKALPEQIISVVEFLDFHQKLLSGARLLLVLFFLL